MSARGANVSFFTDQAVNLLAQMPPALVVDEIERDFTLVLGSAWARGWLPGEVIRQIKRATSTNGGRMVALAVAVDHSARASSTLHPKWQAHVEGLGLPTRFPATDWLRSQALTGSLTKALPWRDIVDLATSVTLACRLLGPLSETIPPPGTKHAEQQSMADLTSQAADPILTKVRRLLAKAESTTFDAEAEAFTAKAQELMARHAIDLAMLWDSEQREDRPTTIRLALEEPYVDAKSTLIAVVAEHSQCRAVLHPAYAIASLIGFEADLAWCETLYTSLLIQAQREMSRAGAADGAGGHRRTRSFRSSFLTSYVLRIGERLAEINEHVQNDATAPWAEAADGRGEYATADLLPVLADRQTAIDDEIEAQFGQLSTSPIRGGRDPHGWSAGRQAADLAQLSKEVHR